MTCTASLQFAVSTTRVWCDLPEGHDGPHAYTWRDEDEGASPPARETT